MVYATALQVQNILYVFLKCLNRVSTELMYQLQVSNFVTVQHTFNYVSKRMSQYIYVSCIIDNYFLFLLFVWFFIFENYFSAVVFCDLNFITINYKLYATALQVQNIEYL